MDLEVTALLKFSSLQPTLWHFRSCVGLRGGGGCCAVCMQLLGLRGWNACTDVDAVTTARMEAALLRNFGPPKRNGREVFRRSLTFPS